MLEHIALKLATGIKSRVPDHPASLAVLKFAIAILLNTISIILFTLLISVWTGKTIEAAIALISFAALRQMSGGVHLRSGLFCVAVSTGLLTLLSLARFGPAVHYALSASSLLLVLLFAPSGIEKQSRIPKRHYPKLKLASAVLVLAGAAVQSPVLTASLFAQSLTLIKPFRRSSR